MRTTRLQGLIVPCALGLMLIVSGCQSGGGVQRTERSTAQMTSLRDDLTTASDQIDATIAALNRVVATADTDPRPAYRDFTRHMANTQNQADRTRRRVEDMNRRVSEYLDAWAQELRSIESSAMRATAEERMAAAREAFAEIDAAVERAGSLFRPFMSNLNDIKRLLDNELNAGGIASAQPFIQQATVDADAVKEAIAEAVAAIDELRAAWSAANPQPQGGGSQ